jgi:transmembrane sensor
MSTHAREAEEARQTIEEEAASVFLQRLQGGWSEADQAALEVRLERDPAYADAYRRVQESWSALDSYAETPEIIARREKALVYARRANARRWLTSSSAASRWRAAAVAAGLAALLVAAWQLSPYGYRPGLYHTGMGEQRLVDLDDHSRIALDAKTRLQVRYTQDARVVELQEGQAQFYVARDPARPFKVRVGDRTIVALGTVFTVEYVEQNVRVAMMEGRVAILVSGADQSSAPPSSPRVAETPIPAPSPGTEQSRAGGAPMELAAGEELRVASNGRTTVAPADLESATAWREGKVIFRGERMDEAVRRLNRYSRLQIQINGEALAEREISGVFEAGDTQGFVGAVQRYYPVTTEYVGNGSVRLSMN